MAKQEKPSTSLPKKDRPELKGIKERSENEKKKMETIVAGILSFAEWLLKEEKEGINKKEDEEKTAKNTLNKLRGAGIIETVKLEKNHELKTREFKKGEVVRDMDLLAINLKDILKVRRRSNLAEKGIFLSDSLLKLRSISLFREGIGTYENFKKTACTKLQPNVKDPAEQVNKTAEILAKSSIGKYQIRPVFHFQKIGLEWRGEEGLKNIHKFLRSESLQNELNFAIIDRLGEAYNWNLHAMAAAYYCGGGRTTEKVLNRISFKEYKKLAELIKQKNEGPEKQKIWDKIRDIRGVDGLFKAQEFGFRSVAGYVSKAGTYLETSRKQYPNKKDRDIFQMVIAKKETGYLRNGKVKMRTTVV